VVNKEWQYHNPQFEYENDFSDIGWPWSGHRYFAYDLTCNTKPKVIVELGTHKGTSFFSFCQAVKDKKLSTKICAVDTWKGDKHAGFYGDNIYKGVQDIIKKNYAGIKTVLLRMTFDEAVSKFQDKSIDILHIDGLHTYEAVKHDFENWISKVADNGIVLLHDIAVIRDNFGVFRVWEEVKKAYPHLEFMHSFGLGVLYKSNEHYVNDLEKEWQAHYACLNDEVKSGKIISLEKDANQITDLKKQVAKNEAQLKNIYKSKGWRTIMVIRKTADKFRKLAGIKK